MNTLILAAITARELAFKVTVLLLAGISTLILLLALTGLGTAQSPEGTSLLIFGQQTSPPLDQTALTVFVRGFEASATGGLFLGVILFGVLATAGLIPDTLERGTVDLYLSRPLARGEILAGRTLGGAAVILANIAYFLLGLWLIFGIRLGVWDLRFLAAPAGMTLGFLCLYAIVAFLGTLSRNTVLAIIGGFLYQFVLVGILQNREATLYRLSSSEAVHRIADGLYYLFPQTAALQETVMGFIAGGDMAWGAVAAASISAGGWYLLAWWVMERSDF